MTPIDTKKKKSLQIMNWIKKLSQQRIDTCHE